MKQKFVTPRDAKPVRIKRKICNYVPLEYDFKITRFGLTWLHVKGGFSGQGDREDWMCDLPPLGISVHNYNWDGSWCEGVITANSFEGALEAAICLGLERAKEKVKALTKELSVTQKTVNILEGVVARIQTKNHK